MRGKDSRCRGKVRANKNRTRRVLALAPKRVPDAHVEGSEDLPDLDVLAQEIADDLQTALDQFASIAGELKE